jgi:hypothetical protein
MTDQPIQSNLQEFKFSNGNKARLVIADAEAKDHDLINQLGIGERKAVFIVAGSAATLKAEVRPRLKALFSRGVAKAAAEMGAVIITGGTHCGVMEQIGLGVADQESPPTLIGVTPRGKAIYPGVINADEDAFDLDPNHSHFVLADCDAWGCETRRMFSLAKALAESKEDDPQNHIPVILILAGGKVGSISANEVLLAVRNNFSVVVINGSGELSDELVKLVRKPPETIENPELAEIVEDGKIFPYNLSDSPAGMRRQLGQLARENELLRDAWRRFAVYDQQSMNYQGKFDNRLVWMLRLGVIITFLVVLNTALPVKDWLPWYFNFLTDTAPGSIGNDPGDISPKLVALVSAENNSVSAVIDWLVRTLIIALPIVSAALLSISNRLAHGQKFILLRYGAEAIRRAIYIYRTRPFQFSQSEEEQAEGATPTDEQKNIATREQTLERTVASITRELMQTQVNQSSLPSYRDMVPPKAAVADGDDGFSFLTPERYLELRIDHQIEYYRKRTIKYEKQLSNSQVLVIAFGALGTFLAAVELELWVAVTTALVAAISSYLQYRTTENTLVQYNQTANTLQNIKAWWMALPPGDQANKLNVNKLVTTTETVLASEQTGWMQQMQDALAGLREEEAAKSTKKQPPGGGPVLAAPPAGETQPEEPAGGAEEEVTISEGEAEIPPAEDQPADVLPPEEPVADEPPADES